VKARSAQESGPRFVWEGHRSTMSRGYMKDLVEYAKRVVNQGRVY